jgi:hypothetical protein
LWFCAFGVANERQRRFVPATAVSAVIKNVYVSRDIWPSGSLKRPQSLNSSEVGCRAASRWTLIAPCTPRWACREAKARFPGTHT